jgi:hypothetical protein
MDSGPAPAAIAASVPIPTPAAATSSAAATPDIGELADRVYDILVRRLAVERDRRGLAP